MTRVTSDSDPAVYNPDDDRCDEESSRSLAHPRVFLLEETRLDAANTSDFGTVVYVFDKHHRRPSLFDCTETAAAISQALDRASYDPATDYICLAGNMIGVALLTSVVAMYEEGARLLVYDARQRRYSPVRYLAPSA